jgi:hypothetical protein
MATGSIGGQPTITARNFAFGSSLSNFNFYTCPANTVSYVNLRFCERQVLNFGNVINQIGVSYTAGYVGTQYKQLNYTTIGGFGSLDFGPLMGFSCWFTASISALPDFITTSYFNSGLLGQADNPVALTAMVGTSGNDAGSAVVGLSYISGVSGQLILYPGQSLYVSATVAAGIINIIYDTLEVTAGA